MSFNSLGLSSLKSPPTIYLPIIEYPSAFSLLATSWVISNLVSQAFVLRVVSPQETNNAPHVFLPQYPSTPNL